MKVHLYRHIDDEEPVAKADLEVGMSEPTVVRYGGKYYTFSDYVELEDGAVIIMEEAVLVTTHGRKE